MNNVPTNLVRIFKRTDGYCHLTGQKLALSNYGKFGERGAWEIEHSVPRSKGGTNHLNNLFPAGISANRSKADGSTRMMRLQYGLSRAPLSRERKDAKREENQWGGLALGALIGLPLGPVGVGIFAVLGALIASEAEIK